MMAFSVTSIYDNAAYANKVRTRAFPAPEHVFSDQTPNPAIEGK